MVVSSDRVSRPRSHTRSCTVLQTLHRLPGISPSIPRRGMDGEIPVSMAAGHALTPSVAPLAAAGAWDLAVAGDPWAAGDEGAAAAGPLTR